jgi:hypothetical protein
MTPLGKLRLMANKLIVIQVLPCKYFSILFSQVPEATFSLPGVGKKKWLEGPDIQI